MVERPIEADRHKVLGGPLDMPAEAFLALQALTQAHCYWCAVDATELARLGQAEGRLDGEAVKRILKYYRAARSVRSADRQRLADALNERVADFAGKPLVERAAIAVAIAQAFRDAGAAGDEDAKTPFSAVSKLMWFLSPTGWTMYDSLARAALGIRSYGGKPFLAFYARLDAAGFAETAKDARGVLFAHGLPSHLAERSIDFLLMTAGGRDNPSDGAGWVSAYVSTRRPEVSAALMAAAVELAVPYSEFLQRVKTC